MYVVRSCFGFVWRTKDQHQATDENRTRGRWCFFLFFMCRFLYRAVGKSTIMLRRRTGWLDTLFRARRVLTSPSACDHPFFLVRPCSLRTRKSVSRISSLSSRTRGSRIAAAINEDTKVKRPPASFCCCRLRAFSHFDAKTRAYLAPTADVPPTDREGETRKTCVWSCKLSTSSRYRTVGYIAVVF